MYQSGAHLVERRDVPQDAYFRAYEAVRTAEAHDIEQVKIFEEGWQHLRQTYRQQLHTMIGEGHLKRYLRLHRKRMQRVKTAQRSFRPSREGFKEQAEFYAGLIQGSTRLIHASGVDVRGVQPLARHLHARAWELFEQTVGKAVDAPTTPTGPNQEYRPPRRRVFGCGSMPSIGWRTTTGVATATNAGLVSTIAASVSASTRKCRRPL